MIWDHNIVYEIQRVLLGPNDFIGLVIYQLKERLYHVLFSTVPLSEYHA